MPGAMIFVCNRHGALNPREAMEIEHFVTGVAVMRAAILDAVL
jgi:beta-ureidopropionase / N-carbamoyl-L-amino-acid hydrolase